MPISRESSSLDEQRSTWWKLLCVHISMWLMWMMLIYLAQAKITGKRQRNYIMRWQLDWLRNGWCEN